MTSEDGSKQSIRRVFCAAAALLLIFMVAPTSAGAAAAAPTPTPSAPAKAAPAALGSVTFGLGPASATKLDQRPDYKFFASPGGQAIDHVAIVNLSAQALPLIVYATEAVNDASGGIGYQAQADADVDAATWLSILTPSGTDEVTVPAHTNLILPVRLAVPANASPGDHTAGLAVAINSKVAGSALKNLTLQQRVAVRAYVRVSGPVQPKLSIEKLHASYEGTLNPLGQGKVKITYTVKNTGDVNLSGKQRLSVSGLLGSAKVPAIADIPLLLPGGSIQMSMTVPNAWPMLMLNGKVTVTPVAGPADVDPGLVSASASAGFWAVPWTLLAIIAVVIIAIVAWFVFRRRRSVGWEDDAAAQPPTPVGVA